MSLTIPTLSLSTASFGGNRHAGWKLGQITQGIVAGKSQANPTVNIGGTNYQLTSQLQFSQGESLLLKVSGVTPKLEFSVVARSHTNVGNSDAAAMMLPDRFLQNSSVATRNMNASVSTLLGLLHSSSTSPLPPATALLIESMKNTLLRAGSLTSPKRLERSLLGGSLLVGRPSGSANLEGGLSGLLKQIADSLEGQKNSIQRLPPGVKYQQALGLSLYLSGELNFLRSLTREVGEQYSNLLNLRNKSQEDMQQHAYRLMAELPVLFRNHVKSISIRFLARKAGETKEPAATDCCVEFEFEFGNGKIYTRITIEGTAVSFSIGCEQEATAGYLAASKMPLGERLSSYGLSLSELTVVAQDDYLPRDFEISEVECEELVATKQDIAPPASAETNDETTRLQLREILAEGKMPDLEEFSLRIDNHDVAATHGIPAHLYCTMACFFAQLFEAEEDLDTLL